MTTVAALMVTVAVFRKRTTVEFKFLRGLIISDGRLVYQR
jgi:hypothetical protein